MQERSKIKNPEIEAEIYYLTAQEGGRNSAVGNGYRGQFYYDGKDWDALQEFMDKEICQPGETVKVKMWTLSPDFHTGKLWIGKEFKIREGARTVGRGIIKNIFKREFNHWKYDYIFDYMPKDCRPYDNENIEGFVTDFDYLLGRIIEIKKVTCKVNLSNRNEMIIVNCELENKKTRPRPLIDKICKCWREELALMNSKFKIELNFKNDKFKFVLSFVTWHSMYLTGKIIIEK